MVVLRQVQHALPDVPHQSVRLGAPLDKWGQFVVRGVAAGVYDLALSRLDETLSSKDSASYLLKEVAVSDDLKGLLLIAPPIIE